MVLIKYIVVMFVFLTEQRDDELSGAQEAVQSQSDDNHLHYTPLLPLLPRRLCLCHIHHVDVSTHTQKPLGLYQVIYQCA